MLATLTIPAKQLPFPYAAAAIAAYTGKANIDIEGSASALNLEIDGSSINQEETIVQILAKESGLSEDSEKAIYDFQPSSLGLLTTIIIFRLQDFLS